MPDQSFRLTFAVSGDDIALLAVDVVAMRALPSDAIGDDRAYYGIWVDLFTDTGQHLYRRSYEDILTWDEESVGLVDDDSGLPLTTGLSRHRPRRANMSTSFELVVPHIVEARHVVLQARGVEYSFGIPLGPSSTIDGAPTSGWTIPSLLPRSADRRSE